MEQDLAILTGILRWTVIGGVALFLARIVLSIWLRGRVTPALRPGLTELADPSSTSRFVSLIGHLAKPIETMGTTRLRATLGLQIVYWGVGLLIAISHNAMQAPVLGIETLILLFVLVMALHTSLYEIEFDRQTITLPRWWFGRTRHKWSDLLAIGTRDRWFMTFSFDRGPAVRVHKYVVGHDLLVEAARKALRET